MSITLSRLSPPRTASAVAAFAIAALSAGAIVAVWSLEHAGYTPCELCLRERVPLYWGLPLALLVGGIALKGRSSLLPAGFAALAIAFVAGAALGVYHTGVEWQLWPGPSSCTGAIATPAGIVDFRQQLEHTQVVRCDAPALQVFGLSLAAWNVVLSLVLAGLAGFGLVRSLRAGAQSG